MTRQTIMAIVELLSMAAAVVLFFLGISSAVRSIKVEGDDKAAALRSNQLYKRSFILIGCAIAAFMLTRLCYNLNEMGAAGADSLTILLQSLWEAVYRTGFIILIPFVIRKGNRSRVKREET